MNLYTRSLCLLLSSQIARHTRSSHATFCGLVKPHEDSIYPTLAGFRAAATSLTVTGWNLLPCSTCCSRLPRVLYIALGGRSGGDTLRSCIERKHQLVTCKSTVAVQGLYGKNTEHPEHVRLRAVFFTFYHSGVCFV